jgi:RNA polymerase sigma-70 factor (ECF subfamily)
MNPAIPDPDELIPTRRSLLTRLKDWEDDRGWKEFFDTYWKLIYGMAIKSRLTDEEAQEVVQETLITVAKNIKDFKTDPAHGSFKAWLLRTTRWRIINQFKKRRPDQLDRAHRAPGDSRETATLDRIRDPNGLELEAVWDREWEKNLMDVALERLKRRVNHKHYQIFYLNVIKQMPAREVAQSFGASVSLVYMTKLRLSRLVKKIYEQLNENGPESMNLRRK